MAKQSRQRAVRELLWEWDPLGDDDPTNPHLPRDEYDWLVRGVERELEDGVDTARLIGYLTNAVRARYGLDDPPPPDFIAERLVSL
jgi:hypothetical protein